MRPTNIFDAFFPPTPVLPGTITDQELKEREAVPDLPPTEKLEERRKRALKRLEKELQILQP